MQPLLTLAVLLTALPLTLGAAVSTPALLPRSHFDDQPGYTKYHNEQPVLLTGEVPADHLGNTTEKLPYFNTDFNPPRACATECSRRPDCRHFQLILSMGRYPDDGPPRRRAEDVELAVDGHPRYRTCNYFRTVAQVLGGDPMVGEIAGNMFMSNAVYSKKDA